MRDFSRRSPEVEWMDTVEVPPEEFAVCLGDLAVVNRLTFTHRPTLRWLARAVGDREKFSLLDVGFGQGDALRAIAKWARKHGKTARLSGVDLDPSSELAARAATPADYAIDYRTGDALTHVPDETPDFVVSSLMAHHLPDTKVVEFVRWMERTAGRGWFVNDLHRHWLAYYGFRALAAVARWHRFVGHDGAVSIARAFVRADWERYLAEAPAQAEVEWLFPFRLCVGRLR